MRVLILGEGKSGTTALMRSVVACLDDPTEIFEPKLIKPANLEPESLVVKKLMLNWRPEERELADRFDKRLHIVRDPRDRLISHLLYDAYNRAPRLRQDQRDRWLTALEKKAEDPSKLSMARLINIWWRVSRADLMSHYVRALDRGVAFLQRSGDDFFALPYEDYVAESFEELNDYLGLTIKPGVVTGAETRVARSKSSGAWREWFTPSDVKLFRPMTHRWLKQNGRNTKDWDLDEPEKIDPETSVEYVRGLFDRVPVRKPKP